jgi:nitric oxide reductase NorE protein
MQLVTDDTEPGLMPPATARDQERRIPGEPGLWIVIIGDMLVFSILFGLYLHYRAGAPELFAKSQDKLAVGFGLANTLVMLSSSVAVVAGVHAARADRADLARRAFAVTMALGLVFVTLKGFEWGTKINHDLVPNTNDFFMLYYVLTGIHLGHVLVGILVLGILRQVVAKGATTGLPRAFVEGGAVFWHMVDMIWLVLFPLVYLAHSS